VLGCGDARGDDGSRDIASASQGSLGFNKDVRNVLLGTPDLEFSTRIISRVRKSGYLLFAKQWKMQENFKRLCIGGEDDEFGDTTVQGFSGWEEARMSDVSRGGGEKGQRRERKTYPRWLPF